MTTYLPDGTWASAINGSPRLFHATMVAAVAYAMEHGAADLTNTQAVEYAKTFKLTDNANEPHQLMREICDCGYECNHATDDSMCFTTVTDEDLFEDETVEESLYGFDCYYVERNDRYKQPAKRSNRNMKLTTLVLAVLLSIGSAVAAEPAPTPNPDAPVWINTPTNVYHCMNTPSFKPTKSGEKTTQSGAQKKGARPARGKFCSK